MKSNQFKPEKKKKKEKKEKHLKAGQSIGRATKEVLGGEMLEKEKTFKLFPYLIFLALLAFIYIANDFALEKKVRKISAMQKELMEMRYEYVSVKSNLINISKQSQLAKRLENLGIKENRDPVRIITINKK